MLKNSVEYNILEKNELSQEHWKIHVKVRDILLIFWKNKIDEIILIRSFTFRRF